jgi:hypothetical protein
MPLDAGDAGTYWHGSLTSLGSSAFTCRSTLGVGEVVQQYNLAIEGTSGLRADDPEFVPHTAVLLLLGELTGHRSFLEAAAEVVKASTVTTAAAAMSAASARGVTALTTPRPAVTDPCKGVGRPARR